MKTSTRIIIISLLLVFTFQNLYSKGCFPHMGINGTMFIWTPYKDTAVTPGTPLLLQALMANTCFSNSCCCTFSYSWFKDSVLVSNASSYSVNDSGYFMCNCMYQNCDGNNTPFTFTVHVSYLSSPTGVYQSAYAAGFSITPNPITSKVSITYNDQTDWLKSLKIFTSSGKVSKNVTCCFNQLEMKNEDNGIYFYEAITEKGKIFRGRFLKIE
jgi:hypothetical protein